MSLWVSLFTLFVVIFGAGILVWWQVKMAQRQQEMARSIARNVDPSKVKVTSTVLVAAPVVLHGLARFAARARQPKFLLITFAMALAGVAIGGRLTATFGVAAPAVSGALLGAIPWLYRARKRKKRLTAIEEQFPDALDFLGRSVRAGNAFSISLELLAAEASEPLKSEILKVTREMALGASLEDALNGLATRVALVEVRFFISAVQLQKETGGNLNEVLSKLAVSVRERLRLRGQVKAMSGQGRLSAAVLSVLPLVLIVLLKFISPTYLDGLTGDQTGRNLLGGAAVSQIIGFLVMQKIIKIEV